MSMTDLVAIGIETLRIDIGCSFEKEFTELIRINPWMILYLTFNQVNSFYGCVCGPFNWDAKNILWMDDHVLDTTWSPWRWLCDQDGIICPRYLRRLTHGMRYDEILGQDSRNIGGVPDDFIYASILTWVIDWGLTVDHTLSHLWVSFRWRIIHTL